MNTSVFAQDEIGEKEIHLSIVSAVRDSLSTNDGCQNKLLIKVMLINRSDSVVYFSELSNSIGYKTFSFEIQMEDSSYQVTRTHRLWWRSIPTVLKMESYDSAYFYFELLDSTCNADQKHQNTWQGLPLMIKPGTEIKIIYHPPSPENMKFYESILNRRNYRISDYRDSINFSEIKTEIFSEPKENGNRIYNKRLMSHKFLIE
jgi:hypothetical protein